MSADREDGESAIVFVMSSVLGGVDVEESVEFIGIDGDTRYGNIRRCAHVNARYLDDLY